MLRTAIEAQGEHEAQELRKASLRRKTTLSRDLPPIIEFSHRLPLAGQRLYSQPRSCATVDPTSPQDEFSRVEVEPTLRNEMQGAHVLSEECGKLRSVLGVQKLPEHNRSDEGDICDVASTSAASIDEVSQSDGSTTARRRMLGKILEEVQKQCGLHLDAKHSVDDHTLTIVATTDAQDSLKACSHLDAQQSVEDGKVPLVAQNDAQDSLPLVGQDCTSSELAPPPLAVATLKEILADIERQQGRAQQLDTFRIFDTDTFEKSIRDHALPL